MYCCMSGFQLEKPSRKHNATLSEHVFYFCADSILHLLTRKHSAACKKNALGFKEFLLTHSLPMKTVIQPSKKMNLVRTSFHSTAMLT